MDNTVDVGPFPKRWVLTPSKVLGNIARTELADLLMYSSRIQ